MRIAFTYNLRTDETALDQAEFDPPRTVEFVFHTLQTLGHEVAAIEVTRPLEKLVDELRRLDPDLVFNMAEGTGERSREALIPAVLESLDIPFTGSDSATMLSTLDKAWAKAIVTREGLPTPSGAVVREIDDIAPEAWSFPAVVKPLAEGSSKGIGEACVVDSSEGLNRRIREIVEAYPGGALVERYLPGREFTVGVLEPVASSDSLRVLPPMEIVFPTSNDRSLYSYRTKLAPDRRADVRYDVPASVSADLEQRLRDVARRAFRAPECRDVARIDLRLDDCGRVHFLECNPLPGLTPGWSDLPVAAEAAGLPYRALVGEILAPAVERMEGADAGRTRGPVSTTRRN